MSTELFTRSQYLACSTGDRALQAEAHRRYYSQLVTPRIMWIVKEMLGEERIKASTDPHFNDIPLREWDKLDPWVRKAGVLPANRAQITETVTWSLSDSVCTLKCAAHMIRNNK